MKRTDMVIKGTKQLVVAENAIEGAICEVATLTSDLGRMRLNSNFSAVIGQDAMTEITDGLKLLTEARGAMVRAHHRLNEVKVKIGCGAMAEGPGTDKGNGGVTDMSAAGAKQATIHRIA